MPERGFANGPVEPSRPYAPGYGIPRRHEGMLPWSYVDERMAASLNYWVATTRPDGRPHVVPVWGLWVDGTFFFGGGPRSRKVRNLVRNPNVVVHLESGDDVVVLEGVAEPVTDPDPMLTERLSTASADKYGMAGGSEGYYAVRPSVVFAWSEGGFPWTATRWVLG